MLNKLQYTQLRVLLLRVFFNVATSIVIDTARAFCWRGHDDEQNWQHGYENRHRRITSSCESTEDRQQVHT